MLLRASVWPGLRLPLANSSAQTRAAPPGWLHAASDPACSQGRVAMRQSLPTQRARTPGSLCSGFVPSVMPRTCLLPAALCEQASRLHGGQDWWAGPALSVGQEVQGISIYWAGLTDWGPQAAARCLWVEEACLQLLNSHSMLIMFSQMH